MPDDKKQAVHIARFQKKLREMTTDELIALSRSLRQRTQDLTDQLKVVSEALEAEKQRRARKKREP